MENRISNLIKTENGKADITHALQSKWGDSEWSASGSTYAGIRWSEINEIPKPTEAEFDAEVIRLQAEYDAQGYARSRATEYPSIQDQLDLQYWDKVNSTSKWDEAVKAIKDKHPKG